MPRVQTQSMERYRISVPSNDSAVIEWIESQANLSYSFRELVKNYIREYGMTDATCLDVIPGGRRLGRPKQRISQNRDLDRNLDTDNVFDTGLDASDEVSVDSSATLTEPVSKPAPAAPMQEKKPEVDVPTDDDGFVNPDDFF